MPFIKIITTEDSSDYDSNSRIISDSITDWEEVSEDDLAFIKKYRYDLQREIFGSHDWRRSMIILEKDPVSLPKRIADLKDIIAVKVKRDEAAKLKRSAAAKLSTEKRLEARKAREREKFLAMAEKLGVDVGDSFPGGSQGA